MADWERELREALEEGPRWPGDPEQLWQRLESRLPAGSRAPRPWWRRVLTLPGGGPARWAALAGAGGLATALVAALLLVPSFIPGLRGSTPGTTGLPGSGGSAMGAPLQVQTRLLDDPRSGNPLRFAIAVGRGAGGPVQIESGVLEVRSPAGDLVWAAPIPEFAGVDLLAGDQDPRAEVIWPAAGDPGHYRAGVRLVAVDARGVAGEVGPALTELFVPYPAGSVRLGQVPVGRPVTQGPVTAALDRIILEADRSLIHFALSGTDLAGGFQWSLLTPSGAVHPLLGTDYEIGESRVTGVAAFEPVPTVVQRLVVRLHRVGVSHDGHQVTELPYIWEWEVPLD